MSALKKVLVVDDDPVIGKSFDRVLSRKGYVVVNVENGMEALNKLAAENYDAVFTDIKMPGLDGLEVAERVRAKRPWTPVVIITGYGSDDNEARAKAAGVREFLRKPLSPDMIESSAAAAVATAPAPSAALAAPLPAAAGTEARAPSSAGLVAKNFAMFIAAPFMGLAYVALFPFLGLATLVWTGVEAWRRRNARAVAERRAPSRVGLFVKNLVMFFASPFIALAYIALFPVIGLAMLIGTGIAAWRHRAETA